MERILLSTICKNLKISDIQKTLKYSVNNKFISFALGMPCTTMLPLDKYQNALNQITNPNTLQYSEPSGALKKYIVQMMLKRSINCTSDQIFLTSGTQQAMMLVIRLLINSGDDIIVDKATYPGFIQIAESFQGNLIAMNLFSNQFREYLEDNRRPRLIYTMSEGHNPFGTSLTQDARLNLSNIIKTYGIPALEDDVYGFLNYEETLNPIKYFANDWVFYVGSFSKILSPTIRVGWIVVPDNVIDKLEILKEATDINTATFSQHILAEYLKMYDLEEHLELLRVYYKLKRNKMVNALDKYIPEIKFSVPKSGFFIWCELPDRINTSKLLEVAIEKLQFSFLPGNSFNPCSKSNLDNYLRLSFASCDINLIEEGIIRLAEALKLYK